MKKNYRITISGPTIKDTQNGKRKVPAIHSISVDEKVTIERAMDVVRYIASLGADSGQHRRDKQPRPRIAMKRAKRSANRDPRVPLDSTRAGEVSKPKRQARPSIRDHLLELLKERDTLSPTAAAQALLARGCSTTAEQGMPSIVASVLASNPTDFRRISRGVYVRNDEVLRDQLKVAENETEE